MEYTVSNSAEDPVLAHTEELIYHFEALNGLFLAARNILISLWFASSS